MRESKRVPLLFIVSFLACILFVPFRVKAATTFSDVNYNSWAGPAITWASEQGVITDNGTSFYPKGDCTRGTIVTFLWNANGHPNVETSKTFVDVPSSSQYFQAVSWAVSTGVTAGTGNGKFSPDETVTRAQAVTFLWRNAGSPQGNPDNGFFDVPKDKWYSEAVNWAVANGITAGTGNNQFSPLATCQRDQIITFIYRAKTGNAANKTYSSDELLDKALKYYKNQNYVWCNHFAAIDMGTENDIMTIRLCENHPDHVATLEWYRINIHTGKGTSLFSDEDIDLTAALPNIPAKYGNHKSGERYDNGAIAELTLKYFLQKYTPSSENFYGIKINDDSENNGDILVEVQLDSGSNAPLETVDIFTVNVYTGEAFDVFGSTINLTTLIGW